MTANFHFNDDAEALDALPDDRYHVSKGGIIEYKIEDLEETDIESAAINYLCSEWDYGWMGGQVGGS